MQPFFFYPKIIVPSLFSGELLEYAQQKYEQNVQAVMWSDFDYVRIMASLTDADFYDHFICIVSTAAADHIKRQQRRGLLPLPPCLSAAHAQTNRPSRTHILLFFPRQAQMHLCGARSCKTLAPVIPPDSLSYSVFVCCVFFCFFLVCRNLEPEDITGHLLFKGTKKCNVCLFFNGINWSYYPDIRRSKPFQWLQRRCTA